MSSLAVQLWALLFDFGHLISSVEPVCCHESEFACRLHGGIVLAELYLVDLLSEFTDTILHLLVSGIVALLVLVCYLKVGLSLVL